MAIRWIRRWQPDREIILVGDGTYAAVRLVKECRDMRPAVKLVSRLRLDAALYDPPQPQPGSKRGPKPQKGARQPSLADVLVDPATVWQSVTVPWYGGADKQIEIVSGRSLWHRSGHAPVPICWVLMRCPDDPHFKPTALFCSDQDAPACQIITWFVGRWNIEVTFEEVRAHLGFETQRHWSQRAIERTAPCLFGIFSLVVVMAKLLHPEPESLPIRQDSWYVKHQATFSDALAAVRRHLWCAWNYEDSAPAPRPLQFPAQISGPLLDALCYAA